MCHQLGYNDAIEAYVQRFRSSTIWLDEIQCTTGDQYLSECSHDGWGNVNCGLSNTAAAAVSCNGSSLLSILNLHRMNILSVLQMSPVLKVIFVWLMETTILKVGWKYATIVNG